MEKVNVKQNVVHSRILRLGQAGGAIAARDGQCQQVWTQLLLLPPSRPHAADQAGTAEVTARA